MSIKSSSKNKKHPLRRLQFLITAITLAAVVVTVFLGNQTYHETREMTIEQFNRQQLTLARSAAAGISSYCKELSVALSSLAQLPSIQQMRPECLQEMQHTYWGFPPRTSMRILDSDGVLRFIYPFDGWRGELIGQDYSKETFFRGQGNRARQRLWAGHQRAGRGADQSRRPALSNTQNGNCENWGRGWQYRHAH